MNINQKGCIFNIQRFSIHDGPGIRTSIFFKGCSLSCKWCSNPESQIVQPENMWDDSLNKYTTVGEYMTVEEILNIVLKDKHYYDCSNGGITITGGEILCQTEFARELLIRCKEKQIHTACETSGFSSSKNFMSIIPYLDYLIMDLKHYDSDIHKKMTGVELELILKNIENAKKSKIDMLIRIPIIPNFNSTAEDATNFSNLLIKLGIKNIELLPFHQFGKKKYKLLNKKYEFDDYKSINPKDLLDYKKIIESKGIKCKLSI